MFARSCPRMGMRFASGNVFYMNRMYSARHLNGVGSPLSMGFVTPLRFMATVAGPNQVNLRGLDGLSSDVATVTGEVENLCNLFLDQSPACLSWTWCAGKSMQTLLGWERWRGGAQTELLASS